LCGGQLGERVREASMSEVLAGISEWAVDSVYSFGYIGVFVMIALINLHLLPLPTPLILALAGFLVGQGHFSFILVLIVATAGTMAASIFFYYLGFWVGEESVRRLIKRFERFKLLHESDLDRASEEFERHNGKALVLGHLVPGLGPLVSIPARIKCMPICGRFMVYSVLGSALWDGTFVVLGWILGSQWMLVEQYALMMEYVVLSAMAGGVVWFVWHRWKARR